MDFHFGRRLLVVGFVIALMAGMVPAASAITIADSPEIRLITNEEKPWSPGYQWQPATALVPHPLISIGDVIEVRAVVTPPESVAYVVANLCAYGGDGTDTLWADPGTEAWAGTPAWVPRCSDGASTATMTDITILDGWNPNLYDETWLIWWDDVNNDWIVEGTTSGVLATHAQTGVMYTANNGGDDLFTFTITSAAGVCCNAIPDDCDHFNFETHAAVEPSDEFVAQITVADGGECWIDHNPCWYEGHWDATVEVIACVVTPDTTYCDTAQSWWPGRAYVQVEEGVWEWVGDSLWVDTHWTKYAQLEDPAGYGAEFIESNDYTFNFDFNNSGLAPVFGLPDEILNPSSPCLGLNPDVVCALIDMRKLAHENGNDDIDSLYFDLSSIGDAWTDDATTPTGAVNDAGFWFAHNPGYNLVDCDWTYPTTWGGDPYNGWSNDGVFWLCWNVMPGQTDEAADVEYITMWWISDSGDTTVFPVPTHKLAAIDNIIPLAMDPDVAEPPDTVTTHDVTFAADMTLAGNDDVLNPVSEGNPVADWLQVMLDLEGLYDLDDVVDGGQGWASMTGIGVYEWAGVPPSPFGWGGLRPMGPPPVLAPVWETEETEVIASPPSPYDWDQDTVLTQIWIFDNAGNCFCVGPATAYYPIDNILPIVPYEQCIAGPYIYAEIEADVAFKPGFANVGMPLSMECLGLYNNRDQFLLHADLGDALGADEVAEVGWPAADYDPYCVGGITLFDDGTLGHDPVLGDKNYTGHARLEVGGSTRNDTTFCVVDTDLDSLGFEVLVTDNAGNAAINSSCLGIRVDNEIQTMGAEHVSILFYDDPETIELDGDVNGDGIVSVGDALIFEWRVEDEPWEDMEISYLGIVRVDLSSIDPAWVGQVDLDRLPSGGVWRNYWPDRMIGSPFIVPPGSVDGAPLQANFTNWDNAGNTPGWCNFTSDLMLDDVGPSIDCGEMAITISGLDDIASIGDTLYFEYAGPADDVTAIEVDVSGVTDLMEDLALTEEGGVWTGWVLVQPGSIDDETTFFEVTAYDGLGNEYSCMAGPINVDNQPPAMTCANAWLRLWDYNDNVTMPSRVVNVGDNLTAIYWDPYGDVVRTTADFSHYYDTDMVYEMVSEFNFGPPEKWGYRVDPVPDGTIDEPAGGLHTRVMITAYDDAGNVTSDWFCPMWYNENLMTGNDAWLYGHGGLCSSCLPVDTKRPEAIPPDAIVFELLENSNQIANVGDRLRIIVNMGDPSAPGYDMQWMNAFVQADIHQYGNDYNCADMDECPYLFLTDDGYSAGGEGDGRFSYFFWFDEDDGPTLFEGAPILPGQTELPAADDGTKIRVRAMDDAGNWSLDWTWSDVLVLEDTDTPVPVDNYMPVVDPADVEVTFMDNDYNGILDIGDDVTVTVDMTDALGGPATAVYANLYDWGHPSQDMVPLAPGSEIWSITFTAQINPGDFCPTQPDGGVGLEDLPADVACGDKPLKITAPQVEVLAQDASDNWSAYEWTGAPDAPFTLAAAALMSPPPPPHLEPYIDAWPFVWDWTLSEPIADFPVDTDAPDPVNKTFEFPQYMSSGVIAEPLQDGRIGLQMFYGMNPRNLDVWEFFVYGDLAVPGEIDWNTYLGEPIPAPSVPYGFDLAGNYEWISDVLPERPDNPETPLDESVYHFAVLAVDNANNYSDWRLTWITGISSDATAPTAHLEAKFAEDPLNYCAVSGQVTAIGSNNVDLVGFMDEASEYINVVYVELYGRVKDLDPTTEGYQPGLWTWLDEHGHYPSDHTLDGKLEFGSDVIGTAFDITHCETFELVLVPWDEAGNHLTPDECEALTFTYDPFEPLITMFAVNGNPSPHNMELAGSALVEATAMDQCAATGELTYWFYLEEMGDHHFSWPWPLLDRQTLPVGEPYTYTWDLVNYPQGHAKYHLYVCDQAGNWTEEFGAVTVIDQTAPDGVFAREFLRMDSHPYYTRLLDGHSIMGDEYTSTWFWAEWQDILPFFMYDVHSVKLEWQMTGSLDDWTTVGLKTAYDDSVSWEHSMWAGYEFIWDTRMFSDGDHVTLRATVTDNAGNTTINTVNLVVASEAPILALTIPEATEACGENKVKGAFNIIGTETSDWIDTYYVSYIFKKHEFPDLGDCNPMDIGGWIVWGDTLMLDDGTTSETIWRGVINPDSAFIGFDGQTPLYGMPDGMYDIALTTIDVAGNWSWDKNDDFCVDAGYFEWAVANGMGMTITLQNEAPEVRIRTVNNFGSVDQPWPWPQPVYVQKDDQVTVTSWTERTCDVAKVQYWLEGSAVMDGWRLVAASTTPDDYAATFPETGSVEQYLIPGALQHGYVIVDLVAELTDVVGNVSYFSAPMWILDNQPASAIITAPAPDSYIRHEVALEADAVADDEVYSVTYNYRPVGETTWIPIAATMPHDGDPWNTDVNGNTIYWNTDLVADGAYELAAIAKDADLMDDPNPPVIRVFVDNTLPEVVTFGQAPTYETGDAIPLEPTTWIGGPMVELTATAGDEGGIKNVKFWQKLVEQHVEDATLLATDAEFPYAYTWEGSSFTALSSGWYDLIAEAEDMAGNLAYKSVTVYIDQWAPEGWITQINSDETPGGSNFNGVLAITGWCKDDVPMKDVANQKYDSGLKSAQFQYRPFVENGGGDLPFSTPERGWTDLGGVVTGAGPTYTINWDTGTLVPGAYELRIVGIDNVNNRADVDGTPMLASIVIYIVDQAAPKAIIAGVDKVSGTIWATTETHGQDDIAFVRFEYKPASALETAEWTVIGEVDADASCSGLYGTPWHYASLANGNYWVRAVAYDDDYDVVMFPDLYDKTPAIMMVTINNTTFEVTMAPTGYITTLDRWGNLDDYNELMVKAVCAAGKPTVIVVYDDDPEDHYNTPWAKQLELERPDDQTVWVDGFSTSAIGDWGIVTLIGTYNNAGVVGAKTSTVKVYRVTDREGTKGVVSQDGMSVNIPPGATWDPSEGLMIVKIFTPAADPEIDEIIPVGQTVMMKYLDHSGEFANGLKATVTLEYTPGMIPDGVSEANLRVAHWCGGDREWDTWGISNVTVDQINNKVTFLTTHTGAYAVVAASTLRITAPYYLPGCGEYTGRWPQMFSTIEDVLFGIEEDEIKVILDGPAGNKIFDNMVLYYDCEPADGIDATYDDVSHNLYLALDPTWDWEGYYWRFGGIWDGLPAGTYTLTIKAMNEVGDKKTVTDTFIVDASKPTIGFAGTYVAPNPTFVVDVADAGSGIDPESIFLDIYAADYCYLGTGTPAGMTYDEEDGTVTFGQMTFDRTLGDGMSVDVVVYDANAPVDPNCSGESHFDFCDCCRDYCVGQGIADCAGNHTNPVWRRFTVDGVPPSASLLDTLFTSTNGECGGEVTVAISDVTAGINPEAFVVWVNGGSLSSEGWEFEATDVSGGIIHGGELTFEVDCVCAGITEVEVKVKSVDMVGNFKIMTDTVTFVCEEEDLEVTDLMTYPNPFDPWKGQHATFRFTLSKAAHVTIRIFDFAGEEVTTLIDRTLDPGLHDGDVVWHGTDDAGNTVGTGAYIGYVKIDDGERIIVKNLKIGVASLKGDVCEGQ